MEYLICWTGYGLEWDRWYNVKGFDNAAKLINNYDKGLAQ